MRAVERETTRPVHYPHHLKVCTVNLRVLRPFATNPMQLVTGLISDRTLRAPKLATTEVLLDI